MVVTTEYYYFVFGFLTIAGGVMGYVTKRSVASIISGGICGALLIFAAYYLMRHPDRIEPLILGVVVSVALAGKFIPNYMEKKALIPGGLMALLSIVGVVLTLFALKR